MKKRDVILDFTSLLDVTLIVIFFFVIFSHLDTEDNKAKTEAKVSELETAIEEAKEREASAQELMVQLEKEVAIVQAYSERQASNVEGILEYSKSGNIKIILNMQEDDIMLIRVNCKNDTVAKISSNVNKEKKNEIGMEIGAEIQQAIEKAGYSKDDTIFCDFVFDGSIPGTNAAHATVKIGLEMVKEVYGYLYYSETDLSIGGE